MLGLGIIMIVRFFLRASIFDAGYGIVALTAMAYGLAMLYRFSQFHDMYEMKEFFVQSLFFRSYGILTRDIFTDLEHEEVKRIHREVTGKPLPIFRDIRQTPQNKLDQMKRELSKLLRQPIRSAHLDYELEQLEHGISISISDSWKLKIGRAHV